MLFLFFFCLGKACSLLTCDFPQGGWNILTAPLQLVATALRQKQENTDSNSWSLEVISSKVTTKCMFLQPLEHSNYRQGVKRMRWAHLLVSPTRDSYATRICSTAVLLWLAGLFYQINRAGEKLQKGPGGVNGAIMWQGRAGMERAQKKKSPSRAHQKGSLPLCTQRELEGEGKRGKQTQQPPPSHSTNIRIFLCPQLCYYTCSFLC